MKNDVYKHISGLISSNKSKRRGEERRSGIYNKREMILIGATVAALSAITGTLVNGVALYLLVKGISNH